MHTVRASASRPDFIGMLAVLILLPSWLGLLGGHWWLLDLCAHFRWQYLLASALVLAWSAWRRRRRTLALAGPTLLLNMLLIAQLAWHPGVSRAALADDFALRVVSLNVRFSNPRPQAVLDYLEGSNADLVVLLEVDPNWAWLLQQLRARFPYHIEELRFGGTGIAVLARMPWQQAQVLHFGSARIPSVQVRLAWQGRQLAVIGTHPLSPESAWRAQQRDAQFAWLASLVGAMQEPALVVGDFNATPWSTGLRIVTSGNLAYRSLQAPWAPTWHARSPLALPIDQALCSAPLVIAARSVGPDVGSDHRPLQLTVGWAR